MEGLNLKKLIPWQKLIFLLAGIALIVLLIRRYGGGAIAASLWGFGGNYLAILILSFFWYFLQTLAWNLALNQTGISFWKLFKIKLAGEGLRMLAPFTLVGGDPVRVDLLQKLGAPAAAGSIVTDRAVHSVALLFLIVSGLTIGIWNLPTLIPALRWSLPPLTLVACLFFLINWKKSPEGLFSSMLDSCQRLHCCKKTSPALTGTLNECDRLLKSFCTERSGSFYQALLLHLLAQGLRVAEIYLVGTILLPDFSLPLALTLAALIPLTLTLARLIPGGLGILEGVFAGALGFVLGKPAIVAGLSLVLIRRVRALFWILVGLVLAGNPFKMFLK